jgi:PAS domain S-box-containing protein
MKITLRKTWLQNLVLVAFVSAVFGLSYLFRFQIETLSSPTRFFWLFEVCLIIFTSFIFLMSIFKLRVDALTESRTEELMQTQKLFVELYRNSPVPYVMVDHDGTVTYPNHAALRLFGLEEAGFVDLNIFDLFELVDDEDSTKKALLISRFSNGVFVDAKDILIGRNDRNVRFGLLSIFPYGGGLSAKKKGLMTIVDITKQKEIENAKSEFVSLASHQLRTPISSMKWNLELMKSPQFGDLSEDQLVYFQKTVTAVNKMNSIIEDFLSVSQLELGTKQVNSDEINLPTLMADILGEFDGVISGKHLNLETNYDQSVTTIRTDKRLIHMVISNLVSNATKYTPENGTVRVSYSVSNEGVHFEIVDTGVGIPADELEKLFTKFFRASNVRKQIIEGTGLGLYIVKLAVEKMSGQISVSSKENEGTAFVVTLPLSNQTRVV